MSDPANDRLSESEQAELLRIARETISAHLDRGCTAEAQAQGNRLGEHRGAFVSLHKRGQLRGCIGTFVGRKPLVATVQEMAISASTRDPRFPPLTEAELAQVDLEISVLTPLRPIADPQQIEVGRHGIFITRDFHSGVLLPQVATEYGWDRETFLEHTCMKAGLPKDAWRDPETKIEVFEAQVFGEKAPSD